mmetsp:Transcript_88456/g.286452  ORF Transcript_88456/g.286452 Transcript_88456/m.286452 type:complete len:237 (-) Transcript_88456:284-994(-)
MWGTPFPAAGGRRRPVWGCRGTGNLGTPARTGQPWPGENGSTSPRSPHHPQGSLRPPRGSRSRPPCHHPACRSRSPRRPRGKRARRPGPARCGCGRSWQRNPRNSCGFPPGSLTAHSAGPCAGSRSRRDRGKSGSLPGRAASRTALRAAPRPARGARHCARARWLQPQRRAGSWAARRTRPGGPAGRWTWACSRGRARTTCRRGSRCPAAAREGGSWSCCPRRPWSPGGRTRATLP